MNDKHSGATSTADREIVLTRVLNAPRELVFKVWTDPEHVPQWWGPTGFTTTTHMMDVRPGGQWRYCMHGPDGQDYENIITFIKVERPERLVYKHGGDKETEPVNFEVTVTFEEAGDEKTRLTMRSIFPTAAARDFVVNTYGAIEGGKQHLNRLEQHLATVASEGSADEAFVISRVFSAPRELVWKAWTEPERMARWWGPKGFAIRIRSVDLRSGGVVHYSMTSPEGHVMWGKSVYREITAPERLVFVNSFSDENGGMGRHPGSESWPLEMLTTVTFEPHAGKGRGTVVTVKWVPINPTEAERATFNGGHESMRMGWTGSFDRLAAYLVEG